MKNREKYKKTIMELARGMEEGNFCMFKKDTCSHGSTKTLTETVVILLPVLGATCCFGYGLTKNAKNRRNPKLTGTLFRSTRL